MALNTNFNVDPYYDDFDENKNYHRLLYKPGFAVQSRELTQLQTTLQDQIKKFGDHMFRTGSVVTGGSILIQNTAYLNISSSYSGQDINYINFDKQTIINTANTKRAYVLKSYAADAINDEPITLLINQNYGEPFVENETFYTLNTDPTVITYYANTASANATGNNQSFSVGEGVFYYDGFFVKTQPQSVAVDKYNRKGNAIIGFTISEDIIDYTEDTTLLDPAQGSSNFQAPGADRYKVLMTLDTRPIGSTDLTRFIELGTISEGVPQKIVETPIYGPIADEFARRTNDESGDYIIKNFEITVTDSAANNAFINVSLGSGKAYIKGYEFETGLPTIITIPKPRTTQAITNRRIGVDYGYFIYANGMYGNFATNNFGLAELSLLNANAANAYLTTGPTLSGNNDVYSNTVIGTTRVKLSVFSGLNSDTPNDSNTYIYKLYVTDVNTRSIAANNGYGINAVGGNTTTITLPPGFAANNDVYKGLNLRVVGGQNVFGDTQRRIITNYQGATRNATISPAFAETTNVGTFSNYRFFIETDTSAMESLVVRGTGSSLNTVIASANVHPLTKILELGKPPQELSLLGDFAYQPAYIQGSGSEPLLVRIGEPNIADNTIRDFSYGYKRLYQTVTFTADVSQTLSVGTGETIIDADTNEEKLKYYQVIVTDPKTSFYAKGQTVPSQAFTVNPIARTITVTNGKDMVANIYAVINASEPTSKTKRFIKANTQFVEPVTANSIFGAGGGSGNTSVYLAATDGQVLIAESFIRRTPGSTQHLYVTDVHSINAIFDFNGTATTTANFNSIRGSASANVTGRYNFNTGQRDSYYDWGSISLKPGQTAPRGPLLVLFNRFVSTGSGYFDVSSYTRLGSQQNGGSGVDFGDISVFETQDGSKIGLGDYLDFRPARRDATTLALANTFVLNVDEAVLGPQIAEPGQEIVADYEYYLPRIDRVVLNKSRDVAFEVIQGTSAVGPVLPGEPDNSMTLYTLTYPPYLTYPSATRIARNNNRRYTMKDIGTLDKRIRSLEIYTSLSIAELALLNKNDKQLVDTSTGINRPKNGIFVDSFSDKRSADVIAPGFDAAIDVITNICRGSYNISSTKIFSNTSPANQNVDINGPLLMLASSNTTFVFQNRASKTMNINPFNVVNYFGTIRLDPNSDVWKSTTRVEAQNIDLSGGAEARDAWSSIQSTNWQSWNSSWTSVIDKTLEVQRNPFGTQGLGTSWSMVGSGRSFSMVQTSNPIYKDAYAVRAVGGAIGAGNAYLAAGGYAQGGYAATQYADIEVTTQRLVEATDTLSASRTGILSKIIPEELTKSFGDRLIDFSVVSFMREKNILVLAEKFKPFTRLFSYFDNIQVTDKVSKINRFVMDNNNLEYRTDLSNAEEVSIYAAAQISGEVAIDTTKKIGVGKVVMTSNNNAFIVGIQADPTYGSWSQYTTDGIYIVGDETGKSYRTTKWYVTTGRVESATSSSITLPLNAGGASETGDYVGQRLYILRGTGQGQSYTISGYNPSTRVVTINGVFITTPDATSIFSIGVLETTAEGAVAGIFFLPADVFRTGDRVFRLIDDEFNNTENSRTNGDAKFFAQGAIETKQETSVSVFTPSVQRSSVSESFSASLSSIKTVRDTTVMKNVCVGYADPLAQTFLINPNQYGQGIVVDSIRICFKTKDPTEPVTCQIRPVVNGFPSSAVIYPFAEKTITPDKVNLTTIPDLTDPTKYTEFKFDVPVLLLPGEHSFVLQTNSNGYEAFIAEIGAFDLRTSVKISEQPYTGSLFLSQNGSTWEPEQLSDLMFSIHKRVFTTNLGYAYFEADMSEYNANTVFDLMQLMSTDAVIANTSAQYEFSSELDSGEAHSLLPIIPNIDYSCNDGYGRRILNKTTGNTTFQVRVTLQSTNPDVSPMLDINRLNLLTIENRINNLPLQNTGFVITNRGSGYPGNTTVSITYPSGTLGQGDGSANAYAEVVGGQVVAIHLTSPGAGYITSPNVTISGSSGSGATAIYNGEDRAVGGNANIRYITKKIRLAPGFEAGDLRVYMDAYRPPGSGILVYYKLLSHSDPASIDDNNWTLMTEDATTASFVSKNGEFAELVFAPGPYGSGIADNRVTYRKGDTTYPNFYLFCVKVVMYGTSTVDVPIFAQLRVIALPSLVD